jgi:hypothetical protein
LPVVSSITCDNRQDVPPCAKEKNRGIGAVDGAKALSTASLHQMMYGD